MPNKNELAARLRSADPPASDFVGARESQLGFVATPFFARGGIARVQRSLPHEPVALYVGWAGHYTKVLTGSPESFPVLAKHAALSLSRAAQRIGYVRAYFQSTRPIAKRFTILDRVGDIRPRPGLTAEEQARFDEIRRARAAAVKPIALSDEPPWRGSLYALVGQDLVRIDFDFGEDGRIAATDELIEADLPIAYVH